MKYFRFLFSSLLLFYFTQVSAQNKSSISLAGEWNFKIDTQDVGLEEHWYTKHFEETIHLPGSMVENGKGFEPTLTTKWTGSIYDSSWFYNPRLAKYRQPGNIKFPFWLTPDKYYVGPAWYQKTVTIPKDWKGQRIELFLEHPHWESLVWVDDKPFGMQNSLCVPHRYDLTAALTPGQHTITIRIDNRIKDINPGPDSHSLTDHTQGNWNGIVGRIELNAGSPVFIDDVQLYPDIHTKKVKVVLIVQNNTGETSGTITVHATPIDFSEKINIPSVSNKYIFKPGSDTLIFDYPMGNIVRLWDEFNPWLYSLTVKLLAKKNYANVRVIQFGMRDFSTNGTRFNVNGHDIFLRGTVENAVFPLTGYPPMDEASWMRVFKICKSYGLNHMRFHSYCPPEAAFSAADKMGFYLQPEGPSWANHGSSLGNGLPIDKYIWEETQRIVKEFGNHPSFCMFAYGNEPRGRYVAYLNKWLSYWKSKDKRRLYTGASIGGSWQIASESQYLVRAKPRGLPFQNLPNSTFDYRDKLENQTIPYVSHEVGQYCVFPDFKEISKYSGPLKAKNFELFQEDLNDKHMGDEAQDFLMASGKLQVICYKAEIEAAMRTPGFAGFELLSLNDYPGQGTALVGMLDAFWDEKGYVDSTEFRHFCNTTVPLARIPKFVYKNNESFNAEVEVYHFGANPLINAKPAWKLTDKDGNEVKSGEFAVVNIPDGNCFSLGKVDVPLDFVKEAGKYIFKVSVNGFSNQWKIWVYPEKLSFPDTSSIYFCSALDSKAEDILKSGGKVFMMAAGKVEFGKDVVQQFTPVFWNTSWFKMRPPHTTGILVQNNHPAFADFPTSYHSNYQWWELTNRQQVMNLDSFPAEFRPLVQPIDTWFINRKLGMVFEANVYKGKIMVCSADISNNLENRPAARQLRYSLIKYMLSDSFKPKYTVDFGTLSDLFRKENREGFDSYTKDSPDELKPNSKKDN